MFNEQGAEAYGVAPSVPAWIHGTGKLRPGRGLETRHCGTRSGRVASANRLHRCGARPLLPSRIARRLVGLRPFRPMGVRIEVEAIGDTTLIHHYGHGGSGVTLSWGTARQAVDLVLAAPGRGAVAVLVEGR